MVNLIVKIFPLAAVLISVVAVLFPDLLNWGGSLIVPLLGLIMLGMGSTLSVQDFAVAVKKPRAVCVDAASSGIQKERTGTVIGTEIQMGQQKTVYRRQGNQPAAEKLFKIEL